MQSVVRPNAALIDRVCGLSSRPERAQSVRTAPNWLLWCSHASPATDGSAVQMHFTTFSSRAGPCNFLPDQFHADSMVPAANRMGHPMVG
ncbi:hypothetical protein LAUMK13_02067 [Mycobacterium innocens]|uniref:Uncharacterized protein n=1 Tax=Mycobacterium innocens TaxID=2341083 RepID=A0A498PX59_9MYCO|nr:hypothetical protein LAUMK13_02067 [Mycobacterium innocens]